MLWLGAAEVVIRVSSIASFVVISRIVGPVDLGYFAVALALVSYGAVIGDAGLTVLVQRELASGRAATDPSVTATTAAQLVLGFVAGAALLLVANLLPIEDPVVSLVVAMLPLLGAQALSLVYVLQARERMLIVGVVRLASQGSVAIVSLTLVVTTGEIVWAAAALWIGGFIGDAVCFWLLVQQKIYRPSVFPGGLVANLLARSLPFLGIAFMTQVLTNVDLIVLDALRQPREVGEYSAGLRLVQFVFSGTAIMATVAFPRLARQFASDRSAFLEFVDSLVVLTARGSLALVALVVMTAGAIVSLVLGPEYHASAEVVRLLIWWVPLGFFNAALGQALLASGRQRAYLTTILIAAIVFLGALVVLVQAVGVSGAAIAVLAREGVIFVAFTIAFARLEGARPATRLARQWPYLIVPLAAAFGAQVLAPDPPLWATLAIWATALLVLEAALGWPSRPVLRRLAESAAP